VKKGVFLFLTAILLVLGLFLVSRFHRQPKEPYLVINNHQVLVEIADSPGEITQGLSGRESLAKDRGMLFLFPQPGNYPFWMKEMKFNLDFVFIKGQTVVDLVENVPFPQPGEPPQTVIAKEEFDKVLEVNQGLIKKMELEVGDQLELFL